MAKKILIIDDEVDVLKIISYRLKAKRYEVLTAANGQRGIEVAEAHKPDLILLDYRLPDLEARDVANQIRAIAGMQDVPTVLITASVENISHKAAECGAKEFIAKPIDSKELYEKIERSLLSH